MLTFLFILTGRFDMPSGMRAVLQCVRRMMLQIGAAGQLYARGELRDILPLDEADAHRALKPVGADDRIHIEKAASRERHDAMVRNVLTAEGEVVVIVLGGAHDLSDSLKRLSDEGKSGMRPTQIREPLLYRETRSFMNINGDEAPGKYSGDEQGKTSWAIATPSQER